MSQTWIRSLILINTGFQETYFTCLTEKKRNLAQGQLSGNLPELPNACWIFFHINKVQ